MKLFIVGGSMDAVAEKVRKGLRRATLKVTLMYYVLRNYRTVMMNMVWVVGLTCS